jgi:hypothetical protein
MSSLKRKYAEVFRVSVDAVKDSSDVSELDADELRTMVKRHRQQLQLLQAQLSPTRTEEQTLLDNVLLPDLTDLVIEYLFFTSSIKDKKTDVYLPVWTQIMGKEPDLEYKEEQNVVLFIASAPSVSIHSCLSYANFRTTIKGPRT